MIIEGLCACVDYADMLRLTLPRWSATLDRIVVITAPSDRQTPQVAADYPNAAVHVTEAFYARGASFNKGAAMEEGRRLLAWTDWVLLLDVDILPPLNWVDRFAAAAPRPGWLYGCSRYQLDDVRRGIPAGSQRMPGSRWAGYFQLFHTSDPRAGRSPLLTTTWRHAGGYDSDFERLWGDRKVHLPIRLGHLGERGVNWCGRSERGRRQLRRLLDLRHRQPAGRRHSHEHIPPPTPPS